MNLILAIAALLVAAPVAQSEPNYNIQSLLNESSELYRKGNYDDTISRLQEVMELQKTPDAAVMVNLADAYRDRAQFKDGQQPRDRDADYTNAYKYYTQAIDVAPTFAAAYNHLGIYYYQQNKLALAEEAIKHAVAIKRDYAAAYYNLALVEAKLKKLPEAKQALEDSLRYETEQQYKDQVRRKLSELGLPHQKSGYEAGSYDVFAKEDWSAAETMLRNAVHNEAANDPVAHNNLGYALARQGKYREAIAEYHQALELQPRVFSAAEYNLGQALRWTGDLDGAEKCLKQAIRDSSDLNPLARNALGLVYKQKKNYKEAIEQYKLAIMQSGDSLPVVHFNLGLALEHDPAHKAEATAEYELYLKQAGSGINAASARARLAALKKS